MNTWQEMYKSKLKTIPEVMETIKNGDKILSGIGNGQPRGLLTALAQMVKQGNHQDLCFFNTLAVNGMVMADPEVATKCHYRDAYLTVLPRQIVADARGEYLPALFSDAKRILSEEYDTVMCTVSPMDRHGYFSLGLAPDYVFGFIRSGEKKRVIVEVNEKFPRTFGNNYIHITEVDMIVENTWDLFAVPVQPPTELDMAIAANVAKLVPNGACLQLGIGSLPNAIGKLLEDKKDLGFHSEMVCDAFLHLYKTGALNNSKKNFMPRRGIGTFVFGSQELYDWVAENPGIEMHGAEFVNDPRIACRNDNLIAINGIVETDLTGQCVSEEINQKTYSGLGGQQDFTLAAWWSNGGKAILTLASARKDKEGNLHSNILPKVTGTVGNTRWNVHYIVTEYGIACLKGKTVPQRVMEMIKIAHPDFRDQLLFEAKKMGLTR